MSARNRSAMHGESGYARVANDAYWTPEWCTEALLSRVTLRGNVCEPACGVGHIVRVLERAGYRVVASDLHDHGCVAARAGRDFLALDRLPPGCASIVTNPPYIHAEKFVRRAIELTRECGGQVAMLLRHEWDCAVRRRDLFEREPFARKLTLTRRPRWSEEAKASPRHNFAWFVWDHQHSGPPTLGWLP